MRTWTVLGGVAGIAVGLGLALFDPGLVPASAVAAGLVAGVHISDGSNPTLDGCRAGVVCAAGILGTAVLVATTASAGSLGVLGGAVTGVTVVILLTVVVPVFVVGGGIGGLVGATVTIAVTDGPRDRG